MSQHFRGHYMTLLDETREAIQKRPEDDPDRKVLDNLVEIIDWLIWQHAEHYGYDRNGDDMYDIP